MHSSFFQLGSLVSLDKDRLYIGWGEIKYTFHPEKCETIAFYFPDFFNLSTTPWFTHSEGCVISIKDLSNILGSKKSIEMQSKWNCPHLAIYRNQFNEIKNSIRSEILLKAVPYIFDCAKHEVTSEEIAQRILHLLETGSKQPLFFYGSWDLKGGVLGATPEILIHRKNKYVKTVACAGTKPIGVENSKFLADPKEKKEHNLVIEGILESLLPYGEVIVGLTRVLPLARFSHLYTPIELNIKRDVTFNQLIKVLHPTPALGAFPKKEGLRWLKEYQRRVPRARYGAPVGFWNPKSDEGKIYVGIRNMQWDKEEVWVGAGGGIVADSEIEKEIVEIQMKLQATKEGLGL